jgi:predicted dienelactone hydrolase
MTAFMGFASSARGDSPYTCAMYRRAALFPGILLGLFVLAAPLRGVVISEPDARHERIAHLEVSIWLPGPGYPPPWPLIIFSHGFHGCSTQSVFLMEALAADGYAVFAPNHRDFACGELSLWFGRPQVPFRRPRDWSDQTYADRKDDIEKLIAALGASREFSSKLDWKRIGLAGHSLGGYTVMGIGGAWPRWKDQRIKAVLALSPYTQPFIVHKTLGSIDVPIMFQGGTRDLGLTPFIIKRGGAYDLTPAPKYFVEFDRAGHFGWTNLISDDHGAMAAYSLAFFDRYLKGSLFPKALTKPHPGVTAVRIQQ